MENTIVEAIRNRIPRSGEGAGRLDGSGGATFVRRAGEEVMKNSKKRLVRGRNEPGGLNSGDNRIRIKYRFGRERSANSAQCACFE
jgi:hypothetical protein